MKVALVCVQLFSFLLIVSAVHHEIKACRKIMKNHGLTARFPGVAAHGIHSLTLEDIRYFFKPDATEMNNVPTLNYDLSENATAVLPHAKLYGYDTSFKTISMRHLDQVLRDMDKKNWYLTNYNTLEKLAHTIHMSEVWARTKVHYNAISLLAYKKKLCACVKDTKGNGILKMLQLMALKIRHPGITSGNVLKFQDGGMATWSGNIYKYFFVNKWSSKLDKFNFDNNAEDVMKKASTELVDGDKGLKHLEGEAGWSFWKSEMKKMDAHDDYELALFLYCVLN